MNNKEHVQKKIVKLITIILKKDGFPMPEHILIKNVKNNIKNKLNFNDFDIKFALDFMLKNKLIKQLSVSKKFILLYEQAPFKDNKRMIGKLSVNSNGNGFITLENQSESTYFVHKSNRNGALNNDVVSFGILDKKEFNDSDHTLIDVAIETIVKRLKQQYVCTYVKHDDFNYELIPEDNKLDLPIFFHNKDHIKNLVTGNKIIVSICEFNKEYLKGNLEKIIGHVNDVGVDVSSIVIDEGAQIEFNEEIIKEANNLDRNYEINETCRRDVTDIEFITIDPEDSKDLDDAICVKKLKDGNFRLLVAIADVSHYVKIDTLLDKVCKTRGTSIYLVDRVIPMLPHIISNDICSLNPNEKKLCMVVDIVIDDYGNFISYDVYPGKMISDRRFSYEEVNNFFENKNCSDLKKDKDSIKLMLEQGMLLHKILRKNKSKRGYIEFEINEPKIIVNEFGKPTDIILLKHGEAQEMIEDFMVAANEAVTLFAQKHNLPFIYRVHPGPKKKKLEKFFLEVKRLDFNIEYNLNDITPIVIHGWLENNKNNLYSSLINKLLLRTMGKAEYSIINSFHFGLGSKNYTHFTSPIRRYADLLIHRIFWMFVFKKEDFTDEQREQVRKNLDYLCNICSEAEIRNINIERKVNCYKFCEYMESYLGKQFNAVVNSLTSFGMFVELPNTIEGLVRINQIGKDYYSYDERGLCIRGEKNNKKYYIGSQVKVELVVANKNLLQIEFKIIEE